MDLTSNSLFPDGTTAPTHTTDFDATDFTSAPHDDSIFFLFPSNTAIPAEDIDAPMNVDVLAVPPDSFTINHPAKREPVLFAPHELAMPNPPAHESELLPDTTGAVSTVLPTLKRKATDALLPDTVPFYETTATTTPPTKRARTDELPVGSPTSPDSENPSTDGSSTPPTTTTTVTTQRYKSRSPRRRNRRGSPVGSIDTEGGTTSGGVRKQRTLEHMQSLARSHAPEVALTDNELLQIAGMHESDEQLAESAELYREVCHFKAVLARHGYKLSALTVDPITEKPDANTSRDEQFDFVLKRRVKPTVFIKDQQQSPAAAQLNNSTASATTATTTPTYSRKRNNKDHEHGAHESATCTVCSKTMSDFDTLIRHFRHTHQELKPYCCPRCKGPYSSEGTLWHHVRNVHSEKPRKFRCSHCDASYDSFGAKTRHEHATHTSSEFVCTFEGCNRAFNFPAHLESHAIQDHPGFRPFGCNECKKRFNSANGLIRHKREVHRRNRAYSCSCGTTFAKKDHLKRHLLQRHSMSYEKATEEMRKQPSPGLVGFLPPAAPAAAGAV